MEEQIAGTDFKYSTDKIKQLIKVVGVGGGGGNAVSHMYETGQVAGVSFLLCNTDHQALINSKVPHHIVLGEGLGAGNMPEVAHEAAEASAESIRAAIKDGDTEMVFITAGMGGGTGTGASPVIGRIAREEGILAVGIVTIPFAFEGPSKILKALKGVKELQKNLDAILVVNNQKLQEMYKEENIEDALKIADNTLTMAAKGISDLVNIPGTINLDFADVRTTLHNSGVAVINTGYGEGANRIMKALKNAFFSPLFNNNNVRNAQRLLFNVYSPKSNPVKMAELDEVKEFVASLRLNIDVIWGLSKQVDIPQVAITVLASGFDYAETERYLRSIMNDSGGTGFEGAGLTNDDIKLIEEFYGKETLNSSATKRTDPLILNISELDSEILLDELESTPAIKRSASKVADLRRRYGSASMASRVETKPTPGSNANSYAVPKEQISSQEEIPKGELKVSPTQELNNQSETSAVTHVSDPEKEAIDNDDADVIYF